MNYALHEAPELEVLDALESAGLTDQMLVTEFISGTAYGNFDTALNVEKWLRAVGADPIRFFRELPNVNWG